MYAVMYFNLPDGGEIKYPKKQTVRVREAGVCAQKQNHARKKERRERRRKMSPAQPN
jgi:hypothetical protein